MTVHRNGVASFGDESTGTEDLSFRLEALRERYSSLVPDEFWDGDPRTMSALCGWLIRASKHLRNVKRSAKEADDIPTARAADARDHEIQEVIQAVKEIHGDGYGLGDPREKRNHAPHDVFDRVDTTARCTWLAQLTEELEIETETEREAREAREQLEEEQRAQKARQRAERKKHRASLVAVVASLIRERAGKSDESTEKMATNYVRHYAKAHKVLTTDPVVVLRYRAINNLAHRMVNEDVALDAKLSELIEVCLVASEMEREELFALASEEAANVRARIKQGNAATPPPTPQAATGQKGRKKGK